MKWQLGKFMDEKGNVLDTEPEAEAAFPIRCGPWPNPHDHALCRLCQSCSNRVGISPKGWAYHEQLPDLRPLFCGDCFDIFVAILEEMKK